jgi:hypothetical protein
MMKIDEITVDLALISTRLQAVKRLRKRRKNPMRSALSRFADEIFALRNLKNASYQDIKIYLWKYHRLKISRQAIGQFCTKVEEEVLVIQQSSKDGYWGEVGQ